MTYRFLSVALQDLAEAVDFYEKASAGLGLDFLDEVERTLGRILLNPEAWARVGEHHRRCRTRRFPYGLLYAVERDFIIVTAVMDLRRDPDTWNKRR